MSEVKNVPEIRFEGFSGDWLNHSLDQITDVYDGTHQTPAYTKSGVMFLSAENIKTLTSNKFISEEAFKSEFKIYPQKNDVLMTRIGDVGTASVVETNADRAYYVTLALLKHKGLSPYFLKGAISSPYVQRDIWLRTLHIAFPKKINMNEIKQVLVNCPSDKAESDQIGNTFQKLDSLINQHQQKHDKLSNIKKAMLEKMFPKEGETIPEIRFKEFSGEWEEKVFKDIVANLSGGASIAPTDYQNSGKRTIPKGAINNTGIADLSGSKCVSIEFYEKNILSKTSSGDLVTSLRDLVPTAPNMGRIVKIRASREDFLMPQGVYKLELENGIDENFVIAYSNSERFRNIISREKNGSTQVHIRNGEFLNIEIFKPKYKEQIAIGNYFQKLDALTKQHQQQISKLNNIKQACLSKMFV